MANNDSLVIEDARLIWRNFSGAEGPYNRAGDRNFNVVINHEDVDGLLADGWNVKTKPAREEGEEPLSVLKVKVNFGGRPPKCYLVTSRNKTLLTEELVGMIDVADIENADVVLSPYEWDINGKTGRTAYLESIYVTIRESELDLKYADIPDNVMD